jgi:hypothetical protein
MKRLLIPVLLIAILAGVGPAQTAVPSRAQPVDTRQDPPPDFKGDGCSLFPDGDYGDCCLAHDRDYYRGGTKAERKASDKRLAQCVHAKGHKYISKFMYLGVRIGGMAWFPTPFRWGFGQKKDNKKSGVDPTPEKN